MFGDSNKPPQPMWIGPKDLPQRILTSFLPSSRRMTFDLTGPVLALASLLTLLYFGQANKVANAAPSLSPVTAMLSYAAFMPLLTFALVRLARGAITLPEAFSVTGYGLFGHVFTFVASLALNDERSNAVFFGCLVAIGGMSALRVAVCLLLVIPAPAARLLVCSAVATLQMLSLVFLHFTYMHATFRYAHRL